jgi:hypothetical protein
VDQLRVIFLFHILQVRESMSTDMRGIYRSISKDLSSVKIQLNLESKYIVLSKKLPWEQMAEIANQSRAKKININNGRPLNLRLHLGAYMAQSMNGWDDRTAADMIKHHAAVRVLCGIEGSQESIDHTNIGKFRNQLGPEGAEGLNQLLIQFSTLKGFTGSDFCSSDTTVQEAPIAYPTEVGHLKRIGEGLLKIGTKIKKGISDILTGLQEEAMDVFTEIRLFTRGKKEKTIEKKKKLSKKLHKIISGMLNLTEASVGEMSAKSREKYQEQLALFRKMTDQIIIWIKTGRHPAGKIISLWNQTARAIAREKVSKSTEFGRRWIITRLKNGYVIGKPCQKLGGDSDQNIAGEVLEQFFNCFGGEIPNTFIYDRGGDGPENHKLLKEAGVKNILIFRKGKEKMKAGKIKMNQAKRERALSEASIAVLKSLKYGFNRPRAKSENSCITKGQLAIMGANLTRFSKDSQKEMVS